ncbi:MAG: tRNA (guanosine(37)-N1)-methyltransferase TrmD [Verrucomicrobiae bacterium]|nr:tRNA (guanosine(37)-N1)-methyltransferase TrmD [Verrucomicrobiae bacterium]
MRIDVITIFPSMFTGPVDESIIRRARDAGLLDLRVINLRDFTHDKHKTVDDRPFGGGPGMVMKPEPIFDAVESIESQDKYVILLSASGRLFNQQIASELAQKEHLVLICGGYEGVDERVSEHLANDEISIGDYVLTNGVLPAMVLIDAVTRLLPGALGDCQSAKEESHSFGLLEYPHYTRPAEFRGWKVPEILLSGHHAEIAKWRHEQSLKRTMEKRPDLYKKYTDSIKDKNK